MEEALFSRTALMTAYMRAYHAMLIGVKEFAGGVYHILFCQQEQDGERT